MQAGIRLQAGQSLLRRPPVSAQVAAVLRVWVVSISAAALRDLGLVPAAARPGLGLVAAVAARLRRSSAAAVRLARGSAVAADMVAATAVTAIMVAAAASFPARWPVL
jgi:hypothetical protein